MLFNTTQTLTLFVLFMSAGFATASPVPEPAPIDPGLQNVVAAKNNMGGTDTVQANGALPSSQISTLFIVSFSTIAAGAVSLL